MLYNGRTRNSSTTSSITSSIATSNDNINISNVSPAQPGPASRQPYRRTSTLLRSRSYPSSSTKWSSPAVTVPTSSEESNDVRIRQNVPAARIRTGFEYYLPKQYHEEGTSKARSSDADERAGSFGYVDPFGIRRVIYYKAGRSSGFKARLNNRYVGHDAAPFDPPAVAQQHAQH
ncbi:hypothetical protein QAD02_001161 [Eretmocerus hayati]|uniref:Uncharacterized protein n=1 Tax=Eretmocerus hayati TaxID=131215 RepID=A0ACC2NFG4_9HYME|nr:hypothetical protein QAD02_001161 [Eretmocerus hayati]